ncbi:hypothetical protein [Phenylobacterium sp.]|nr:hypothetical protein [Phenylobacterium sp.]
MEQYSLLILFVTMIAVWLFAWQPWAKRPDDELSQDAPDPNDQDNGRRR